MPADMHPVVLHRVWNCGLELEVVVRPYNVFNIDFPTLTIQKREWGPRLQSETTVLKDALSQSEYTAYLKVVYHGASKLLGCSISSSDRQRYRCINKESSTSTLLYCTVGQLEKLSVAFSKCDMVQHLLYLMGYEDTLDNDVLYISDLQGSLSSLSAFCQIVEEELNIKCDPAGLQTLPAASDPVVVAVYLSYHLYMRVQLLLSCTSHSMLPSVAESLQDSLVAVESSTDCLGLMPEGSEVLSHWQVARTRAVEFFKSGGSSQPYRSIEEQVCEITELIVKEMRTAVCEKISTVTIYLQHVVRIFAKLVDGHRVHSSLISSYQRACARFPKNCWSAEYRQSVEEIQHLLDQTKRRDVVGEGMEKLHAKFKWQSENFLSHFSPIRLILEDAFPDRIPGEVQELGPVMDDVEKSMGVFNCRSFIRSTHRVVKWLVEDNGGLRYRTIDKLEETSLSDEEDSSAARLLNLLGFVPIEGLMILPNYKNYRPILESFLHLGKEALIVCKGDPARCVPVEEIGNVSSLVAYLVYHFRLRCCLLCEETPLHVLGDVFPEICVSLGAVESISDRLRVMTPGGQTRACWETVTEMIVNFATKERRHTSGRREVSYCLDEMAQRLEMDLSLVVPLELMSVFSYASNLQSVISFCRNKRAIQKRTAQVYTSSVTRLTRGVFSNEYCHISDQIMELMKLVNRRQLRLEEVEKLYVLLVWQSENFLSHFRKEAFASVDRRATVFSSQRQVDRTSLPLSEIVIVRAPPQSTPDSGDGEVGKNGNGESPFPNPNDEDDDSASLVPKGGPVSAPGTVRALALQDPEETDEYSMNGRPEPLTSSECDVGERKHVQLSHGDVHASGQLFPRRYPVAFAHHDVTSQSEEYLGTALSSANVDDLASLVDNLVASRGVYLVERNLERVVEAEDTEAGRLRDEIEELEAAIKQSGGCEIVTGALTNARQTAVDSLALLSARQPALLSIQERLKMWRKKRRLGDLPKNTVAHLLGVVLSSVRSFQRQSLVSLVSYLPAEVRQLLDIHSIT